MSEALLHELQAYDCPPLMPRRDGHAALMDAYAAALMPPREAVTLAKNATARLLCRVDPHAEACAETPYDRAADVAVLVELAGEAPPEDRPQTVEEEAERVADKVAKEMGEKTDSSSMVKKAAEEAALEVLETGGTKAEAEGQAEEAAVEEIDEEQSEADAIGAETAHELGATASSKVEEVAAEAAENALAKGESEEEAKVRLKAALR